MQDVFMKRAVELAKKGIGFTSSNPAVGAVIVKGGAIVAEGYHRKAGSDHAEIIAIKAMMRKSGIKTMDIDPMLFHNATLYITLEPCCHVGTTGACTDAILNAGFRKVCVGMVDPFKKVNGRGIKKLHENGVEVEIVKKRSKLSDEIRALNQPFSKWAMTGMPYVIMKSGMSLDGKIATKGGESKWITCEQSRVDARLERSKCDAVLVGSGTVRADDCELAAIGKYKNKKLLRIIIDRKLSLPLKSKVFRDENVFVACSDLASKKNQEKFRKAGVEFKSFGKDEVDIKRLLRFFGGPGEIQSIFVEGGSSVNGSFFDAALKNKKFLDKVLFYIAPKLIGGNGLSVIGGEGILKLGNATEFVNNYYSKVGDDIKFDGVVNFY